MKYRFILPCILGLALVLQVLAFIMKKNESTVSKSSADIICYSNLDKPVYTDRSLGMIKITEDGAGLTYTSQITGKLVNLYMDCIITEDKK